MKRFVEEVFVTEGVPEYTFVAPPNFGDILVDMRKPGKPVIIEGQSGTGKTTAAKKVIEKIGVQTVEYLPARDAVGVERVEAVLKDRPSGTFVIDDFHRLGRDTQAALADLAKLAAEQAPGANALPKLVLIGINEIGSDLIQLMPDVAKRTGIHRIAPGTAGAISDLISAGCNELGVTIEDSDRIFSESQGDYWLTQQLCQCICTMNELYETQDSESVITFDLQSLRELVVNKLRAAYYPAVRQFCRGRRFRPTNDPYYKLLRAVGEEAASTIDLNELANARPDVRGSINNIKEHRLIVLLESKPECSRYFYYNQDTKNFAIEDPALSYFLKHLDWNALRSDCGFRESSHDYEWDIAISFAGENRDLARCIAENLEILDARVFFDEQFEANFLGKAWSAEFRRIFASDSRLVVCLLDQHHLEKIWPTFERECFLPRVAEGEVIPVYLDDTLFVGIPSDTVGIKFGWDPTESSREEHVITDIVYPVMERLGVE
jgi:hypothetical protein